MDRFFPCWRQSRVLRRLDTGLPEPGSAVPFRLPRGPARLGSALLGSTRLGSGFRCGFRSRGPLSGLSVCFLWVSRLVWAVPVWALGGALAWFCVLYTHVWARWAARGLRIQGLRILTLAQPGPNSYSEQNFDPLIRILTLSQQLPNS